MILNLGFNQDYYTLTLILLIKIVLSSKFPWTKFIDYKCFDMKSEHDKDTFTRYTTARYTQSTRSRRAYLRVGRLFPITFTRIAEEGARRVPPKREFFIGNLLH